MAGILPIRRKTQNNQLINLYYRYLFWSDLVYSASYIGRSYFDGSAMSNLIFKDILQPNSLTVDYKGIYPDTIHQ